MQADITLASVVAKTPRVLQMAGIFDVPLEAKTTVELQANLPVEDKPWNVGLIAGPSGAGKSTIAARLWPGAQMEPEWPRDKALIDGFPPAMGIREITGLLSAVGLASPPAWLRPRHVLSTGEGFRADVARVLAETEGVAVVDEFTSVVDRQVARVASHAIQKTVRRSGRQFVAVTCHYDVEDWLQPDWVYDVAAASFRWRSVQRHPPIRIEIHAADKRLWRVFARHHYLSSELMADAAMFVALVDGSPVAWTSDMDYSAVLRKAHRVVVLPDWQGLGLAGRLSEWRGQMLAEQRHRYRITTAHPAFIAYMSKSPRWASCGKPMQQLGGGSASYRKRQLQPRLLSTRTFEYQPPAR